MNRLTKSNVSLHFYYSWYLYVIVALILIIVWNQAFSFYHRIKSNEKLSIYIASLNVNTSSLESYLNTRLLNDELKQINVKFDSISNQNFYLLLNTKGFVNTDIIILPASVLENINVIYQFAQLDKDYLGNYIDNKITEYYNISEFNMGIVIHNQEFSLLDEYITYSDEEYFLFLNRKSQNIGELNNSSSTNALKVLDVLFEVEE